MLEENLLAVGIETLKQLEGIGAEEAFRLIRLQRDPGACLHMLYGIQGAILCIPDKHLPAGTQVNKKGETEEIGTFLS